MPVERSHAATPIRWRVVLLGALFLLATPASQAKFPDLFADDPLATAVRKGSLADTTAALLAGSSANAQAADGTPVIVLAVTVSSLDIVKILIETDATGLRMPVAATVAIRGPFSTLAVRKFCASALPPYCFQPYQAPLPSTAAATSHHHLPRKLIAMSTIAYAREREL